MKITIPETTITTPKLTTILRSWKWGLLVLALTFTWAGKAAQPTAAETQPGAVMSLVVKSMGGDPTVTRIRR